MWQWCWIGITITWLMVIVLAQNNCDSSSFPAKFDVDLQGRPVITCKTTSCFGPHAMKRCPIQFIQTTCTGPLQVIREIVLQNTTIAFSRCCDFTFLHSSTPTVLQTTIRTGEQYNGGEIMTNGIVSHFNLVKNIEMQLAEDGRVEYLVTAYQLVCAPHGELTYQRNSNSEVLLQPAFQHQAPTIRVDQPLPPPAAGELEPLQPPAASGGATPLPPPSAAVTPPAFPFQTMTLMPLVSMPVPPMGFGLGRPRALQAPSYQPQASQTQEEYERQRQWHQIWHDHYQRYPTYPVGGDDGGALLCFSGDVMTQTPTGMKPMRQLEVGDQVLVHDGEQLMYEPILAWLHRLDDQWAEFHRIQTASGQVLELTALHAVYESADCRSTKGRLTYAKDIQVGSCLVLKKEDKITITKVVNITMKWKQGIYAPLTPSGTIIANQLLTSCYSNLLVPTVHQSFYKAIRFVAKLWYWTMGQSGELMAEDLPTAVAFMANTIQDVFPLSMI